MVYLYLTCKFEFNVPLTNRRKGLFTCGVVNTLGSVYFKLLLLKKRSNKESLSNPNVTKQTLERHCTSLNRWSDFEIISLECSLGDPFKDMFAKFRSVKKHGFGKWGLLALYHPR